MTREEAEFFANEMKKVKVQSQEPCEDAVSRQAAIEALQGRRRG